MGKKIITKQDVEKWYFEGIKEISLEDDTIVLPGAKDTLKTAGIKVRPKSDGEGQITKVVDEYCTSSGIDDATRAEIIKLVMAKYLAKLGGK